MDCTNLKVGDKVAVISPEFGIPSATFHPVEKVNKQTIKVNGSLYWKDGGWERGAQWGACYLDTVENGLKLKAENEQRLKLIKVNSAIEKLGLKSSPELVDELLSILDRYK